VADHAVRVAYVALEMIEAVAQLNQEHGYALRLRIRIHSAPVMAGVIGPRKFIYDLWGDTVNTASRMESQGVNARAQVSEATRRLLGEAFIFEERGGSTSRERAWCPHGYWRVRMGLRPPDWLLVNRRTGLKGY